MGPLWTGLCRLHAWARSGRFTDTAGPCVWRLTFITTSWGPVRVAACVAPPLFWLGRLRWGEPCVSCTQASVGGRVCCLRFSAAVNDAATNTRARPVRLTALPSSLEDKLSFWAAHPTNVYWHLPGARGRHSLLSGACSGQGAARAMPASRRARGLSLGPSRAPRDRLWDHSPLRFLQDCPGQTPDERPPARRPLMHTPAQAWPPS